MERKILLMILALAIVIALASYQLIYIVLIPKPEKPTVLRIGIVAPGPLAFIEGRLDKGAGPARVMAFITPLAHQRWATQDPQGRWVPLLAESWSISPDGKTITINIRRDAKWSDGEPIKSEDVVLTYEVLKKEPILDDWGILQYIERIEIVDAKTYRVHLNKPFYPFIEYWFEYIPIPKHIYKTAENYLDPKTLDATETISSGPYKIVGFTKGATTIRMVRNEHYWGKKPAFSEIIITLLSPGAVIPALMATGEYDIIEVEKPAQVADLLKLPNVIVKSFSEANFWSWNMMFWVGLLINTAKYPLSEVTFRQAIAYALDRNRILEIATMGYGELSSMGFHHPNSPHLAPNLPEYRYNTAKAMELIEKLGFIRGADGFWRYPNGTRLTLKIQARAGEETLVGSLVVTMLRDIGIDASLETLAAGLYVSNYNMGYFDIGVIKTSHPDLVDFLMMKFYWRPRVPIGTSIHYRGWTRWDNQLFGDLLEEYRATTDPVRARELSHTMQRIIAEELPFIGLYYTRYIWAYRTDTLRGLEITDLGFNWPRVEFLTSISPVLPEAPPEPIPMVPTLIAVIIAASAAIVYIIFRFLISRKSQQ